MIGDRAVFSGISVQGEFFALPRKNIMKGIFSVPLFSDHTFPIFFMLRIDALSMRFFLADYYFSPYVFMVIRRYLKCRA